MGTPTLETRLAIAEQTLAALLKLLDGGVTSWNHETDGGMHQHAVLDGNGQEKVRLLRALHELRGHVSDENPHTDHAMGVDERRMGRTA